MKWEGHWCGTIIRAENEEDNKVIDAMLERLDSEPEQTYDFGELEKKTEKGMRVVIFNR